MIAKLNDNKMRQGDLQQRLTPTNIYYIVYNKTVIFFKKIS